MTWVDWVVIVFVGLGVFQGLRLGFLAEMLMIAAYLVAWGVASRYNATAGTYVANTFGIAAIGASVGQATGGVVVAPGSPFVMRAVDDASFVVLFLLTRFAVGLVARSLARVPLGLIGVPNRILGGALGGVRNLVIVLIAWTLLAPYLLSGHGAIALPVQASSVLPLLTQLTAHLPVIGQAGPVGGGVT